MFTVSEVDVTLPMGHPTVPAESYFYTQRPAFIQNKKHPPLQGNKLLSLCKRKIRNTAYKFFYSTIPDAQHLISLQSTENSSAPLLPCFF